MIFARSNSARNPRTVVVYSGPTDLGNQLYLDNFDYFLQHGLPSSRGACVPGVAVILVLTTETLARYASCLRAYNATCGELRTITRVNRCYDMESARLALTDESFRRLGLAMSVLANGLYEGKHHEETLSVKEAELTMERRLGGSAHDMLVMQGNLASTYHHVGRHDEALRLRRDVYSGFLKLKGEEHSGTMREASNYAASLTLLDCFEEAKGVLRKMMPVAQRVLGECHDTTLRMGSLYAMALYKDDGATLDNLREAVTKVEETERTARRVLGGAHPVMAAIEAQLRNARAALAARETPSASA